MEAEGDSLGAHLCFPGEGVVSANQKSPVDRHSKEFAGRGDRRAEVVVGRNISFPVGGGSGEKLRDEGC